MPLNVIGLISGGKDSLYSLAHCLENGHNLVALANLYPPPPQLQDELGEEGEDLNSFMYQTVGHTIIPLYGEALDLPLYRHQISGSAVQSGRYYDTSSNAKSDSDETEDLLYLVKLVLRSHPEANALSSGAILSTYQRTRVESVAVRLGLTPVAFLWQYPVLPPPSGRDESRTGLLDDMDTAGCDARIVKIATGGLKESLLWANVTDMKTRARLVQGMQPFFLDADGEVKENWLRGAVLGEGGEYETLAINGPKMLWKKRLNIAENGSLSGEGGASYVRVGVANIADREPHYEQKTAKLRIPVMLDKRFQTIKGKLDTMVYQSPSPLLPVEMGHVDTIRKHSYQAIVTTTSAHLMIKNLTAFGLDAALGMDKTQSLPSTPEDQLLAILCSNLPKILSKTKVSSTSTDFRSRLLSTTLLLSPTGMSAFATLNRIYATHLWPPGLPNPPSRVTIAAPLPTGIHVSLSLTFSLMDMELKKGLHVQGQSYWCPANIGPYSQAISIPLSLPSFSPEISSLGSEGQEPPMRFGQQISKPLEIINVHNTTLPEVIHMAGQIPLVPASMDMLSGCFDRLAVLSLQHLWRVGQERGVDMWPWGVAYLAPAPISVNEDDDSQYGQESFEMPQHRIDAVVKVWQYTHMVAENGTEIITGDHDERDHDCEEENEIDLWNMQNNRSYTQTIPVATLMTAAQHLHRLPNYKDFGRGKYGQSCNPEKARSWVPPLIIPTVSVLPRNASVEWWSTGLANMTQRASASGIIKQKTITLISSDLGIQEETMPNHIAFDISAVKIDIEWDVESMASEQHEQLDNNSVTLKYVTTRSSTIFAVVIVDKISKVIPETNFIDTIIQNIQRTGSDSMIEQNYVTWEIEDAMVFVSLASSDGDLNSVPLTNLDIALSPIMDKAVRIPCHVLHACSAWHESALEQKISPLEELTIVSPREVECALLIRLSSKAIGTINPS